MKNLTLRFPSLESMEAFARQLNAGYSVNKNTLTITAKLLDSQLIFAARIFGAQPVNTTTAVGSTAAAETFRII